MEVRQQMSPIHNLILDLFLAVRTGSHQLVEKTRVKVRYNALTKDVYTENWVRFPKIKMRQKPDIQKRWNYLWPKGFRGKLGSFVHFTFSAPFHPPWQSETMDYGAEKGSVHNQPPETLIMLKALCSRDNRGIRQCRSMRTFPQMASSAPPHTQYETVIGLEVHVQLKTNTKLFCGCSTRFGVEQNENTCPVCLGMPGVLPVLNRQAVEFAILAGLALNCNIAPVTKFDRKQYFYPDMPKNYQISQYDMPICEGGHIEILGETIRITRAHLEEDAGKLVHAGSVGLAGATHSLIDLNRAGMPLLEIVSEPDIRSAEQARVYAETIRNIVRYLGVCDGNLEEGSMRADVNISIRPVGTETLGTKVELKNMNSFRAIQRAVDYEVARQIAQVENGEKIRQESRLWNEATSSTASMRSKEEAHDYRYFPEPDLRPLEISTEWIARVRDTMPELPGQRLRRLQDQYGLSEYDAGVLVEFKELGDFFDETLKHTQHYKAVTNWLMGDITAALKTSQKTLDKTKLTPKNLARMIEMVEANQISSAIAKKLLPDLMETDRSPDDLVAEKGLSQVSDEGEIRRICEEVMAQNPSEVEAFRGGKDKLLGFFVGQVMKASRGTANPELVNRLMGDLLKG
jgi:aspartyl-tRNA(Asn)/glutamyl-tRNA(Gln) amidotransferase subunit B